MKFFELQGLNKKSVSYLFLLKVGFGILLWAIYTFYYTDRATSDIYKFYDDANNFYKALPKHPFHYLQMVFGINTDAEYLKPYYAKMLYWQKPWAGAPFHDNKIIIQINGLFYLFSFGYYNVHTVFMCFLSFVGLVSLYKTFSPYLSDKLFELMVSVFLVPSVLFWGSGVLKEGLIIFSLGLLIYTFKKLLLDKENSGKYFLFFLLSAILLYQSKMYVFIAIIPSLLSLIVVRFTSFNNALLKFIAVHVVLFLVIFSVHLLPLGIDIMWYLHQKQMWFIQRAIIDKAGSYITINYLNPSLISLVKNVPMAIVNTLFRPNIFEAKSLLIIAASVENLFYTVCLIITAYCFKKPQINIQPLFYMCLSFLLIMSVLIGVLTPVLGSIVRYRVPLMPFYAVAMIILIDKQKLKNLFYKINTRYLKNKF